MRNIFLIALTAFLFSCNQAKPKSADINPKRPSKYKNALLKFKNIDFDTLAVYSPENLEGEYVGVRLDSADITLFPEEIIYSNVGEIPEVFAVYKFPIDSTRLALIARTPSEYESSSLKLFIFDSRKDTVTSYLRLADFFGDAGDVYVQRTWLFKELTGNKLMAFMWDQEGHDNSIENENDTTVQVFNSYYLLNLSGQTTDTVSKDVPMLEKKFKNLVGTSPQAPWSAK